MEREEHIALLKEAIQQNEKSLTEMKTLLTDLEGRTESRQRHVGEIENRHVVVKE